MIIVARFNRWITERLLEGARRELKACGANDESVDVAWVPGSFELPQAALAGASAGRYRAVICLGAVIKGKTTHDEHIASSCANGIQAASAAAGIPVTFGVITAGSFELAEARCRLDGGRNLGADAAGAAVEMASLSDRLNRG